MGRGSSRGLGQSEKLKGCGQHVRVKLSVSFLFGSLFTSATPQKNSRKLLFPARRWAVAITHSALLTAMTDDSLLLTGPNCATGTHKGGRLGPASPGEGSQAVGGSRREGPVQAGAASE